jgi:hypothetical protein
MSGSRVRRAVAVALACWLVAAAAVGAGLAHSGTHGNHVGADAQVSADGAVVVESMFILNGGFLVVHAADGEELGRPVGHVAVSAGWNENVHVPVDESFWANESGPTRVYAVLHNDDGDGEFEPSEDPPARSFGATIARGEIHVSRGDRAAYVVAETFSPQQSADASVTISRAALPEDGFLVVRHATEEFTVGQVVGSTRLSAGVHENVSVALNETYFEGIEMNRSQALVAAVYVGDDLASAEPVAVAGENVSSRFAVLRVNETRRDDGWEVVTPTMTTTVGGKTVGGTAATADATGASATTAAGSGSETAGTGSAPGFGALLAVAAATAALALAYRRRGRPPQPP